MKICKQALYVQIIDGVGTVRACGWAGYYLLGNLTDSSLSDIYHGEAAKKFQQSLIDGTYDFCNAENCPYMANGILEDQLIEIEEIPEYPEIVSLAYDRRCNYHCTCCISRDDVQIEPKNKEKIEKEIIKALPHVKMLSGNGLGELFASDSIMHVISKWKPEDNKNAHFELETNGSLFNSKNWEKISSVGNYNMSVFLTVHSFENEAYQYLSGTNLDVNNIEDNLKFVKELRENGIINYFEIATVVQERNFRTLPEFIKRCIDEFGADKVRIRRFLPEKAMDENTEWFFDVRNPLHPYHKEYLKIMENPIFKDPKVWIWTGDHLSNRGDIPAKANYEILKKLFLNDEISSKLEKYFIGKGYTSIILYAITDIAKATKKILKSSKIYFPFILDRNTYLTEWEKLKVERPTHNLLTEIQEPILITLIPRHNEIEENLRNLGYKGEILSLRRILDEIK
ncbi:MAG: radical SAM protein [Lachnospiraceae bacterium]